MYLAGCLMPCGGQGEGLRGPTPHECAISKVMAPKHECQVHEDQSEFGKQLRAQENVAIGEE